MLDLLLHRGPCTCCGVGSGAAAASLGRCEPQAQGQCCRTYVKHTGGAAEWERAREFSLRLLRPLWGLGLGIASVTEPCKCKRRIVL